MKLTISKYKYVPTNTYSAAAAPTIERLLLSLVIYPNRGGYYKREAPIRVRQLLQNLRYMLLFLEENHSSKEIFNFRQKNKLAGKLVCFMRCLDFLQVIHMD